MVCNSQNFINVVVPYDWTFTQPKERVMQVIARYFPHRVGVDQQHRFITGNTRAELVQKAKRSNPNSAELYLACIWATPEGPLIWQEDTWYPEADAYVPKG